MFDHAARRHAPRWIPLWCLLLVMISFGSQTAGELCALTQHCSRAERTLEKALPCFSFAAVLATALVSETVLTVAQQALAAPVFSEPLLFVPGAPIERIERPPTEVAIRCGVLPIPCEAHLA